MRQRASSSRVDQRTAIIRSERAHGADRRREDDADLQWLWLFGLLGCATSQLKKGTICRPGSCAPRRSQPTRSWPDPTQCTVPTESTMLTPATIVASPVIWGRRPHGLSGARVPSARIPAVRWIRPRQVHLRQHTDPHNRLSITGSNGGSGRAGGDTELRKESRSGARPNACKQRPCGYRSRTQRPSRTATQMRSGSSKA
jgi:hypothetical protein